MNRIKTTRKQRFPRNRILDALGLPQCDPNSTLCVCGDKKEQHQLMVDDEGEEFVICMVIDCDCDHFVGIEENETN